MNYKTKSVRCLGIDPGIGNTGWAVVGQTPTKYRLIASGTLHTPASASLGSRLALIYAGVRRLLTEHAPDRVSVESVFFNRNISSCISTASVIAIVELACVHAEIPCKQIKPQQVKAAVTGRGTASKQQVKHFVNKLLSADIKNSHESDAVATAVAFLLVKYP